MRDTEPDKEPAIPAATVRIERDEPVDWMEPLLISENSRHRAALTDLAIDLSSKSAGFCRSLPKGVRSALAGLARAMNCYYSNLIEGHDTHPVDIERALRDDYSADPQKCNLQLEARAHINVQQWIDEGGLTDRATTIDGITEIHQRFCRLLPEELLWSEDPETGERIKIIPGALRDRDVKVGRHIPVSPGALPRFLERFEAVYSKLGKTDRILAAATGHHRLLWIHPFLDGNGRVARLMSHAMLRETLDTGGVWSITRGLARSESAYKSHLMACDARRRNDLDGRGHLSEETLAEFTRYFLTTSIDQVDFMEGLMQPDRLHNRIMVWTEEQIRVNALPARSGAVLEAALYRGELARGDVARITGASERQARRITSALVQCKALTSTSSRAPLHLAFPAKLATRWMPGLFPERVG